MSSFVALVRDGVAQVVDGFEVARLRVHLGWVALPGLHASEFEAYVAAAAAGAMPVEWEDHMRPRRMSKAIALYRSVSPDELRDVLDSGVVRGRGNGFNEFERRRFLFLGDAPTEKLVGQGEMIDRQMGSTVWVDEGFAERHADLVEKEGELAARRQAVADRVEAERNAWRRGMPRVDAMPPEAVEARKALAVVRREMDELGSTFRTRARHRIAERCEAMRDAPFTSAVLEFRPVDHGFHYSKSHGSSGMGDEDEYGFFPGTLRLDDVVRVSWVRDWTIVDVTGPEAIPERLALLDTHLQPACRPDPIRTTILRP